MKAELPKRVAENIGSFCGRAWILEEIVDWLTNGSERTMLLVGDLGTGKSMLMAWLDGYGPEPEEAEARRQLRKVRSLAKAAHFCQFGRRDINPHAFVQNVSNQLCANVPEFAAAVARVNDERVQLTGIVNVQGNVKGGTQTGIQGTINLAGLSSEDSFDRALVMPLQQMAGNGYRGMVLLLVDSLDEANTYEGSAPIPRLLSLANDLPSNVRVLATTRDDPRALKFFDDTKNTRRYSLAGKGEDDVRVFADNRLKNLSIYTETERKKFAMRLAAQAEGVFLYASYVLEELVGSDSPALPDLATYPLPKGLSGLYHSFLTRELGRNENAWFDIYEPLLGLIGVSQGAGFTAKQLTAMVGKDIRAGLRTCKQYLQGELPEGPFRRGHQSLIEFLFVEKQNVDFHIDAKTFHGRVAEFLLQSSNRQWAGCDEYTLRYLPFHLFQAGRGRELIDLVSDSIWAGVKLNRFKDPVRLLDDVDLSMRAARAQVPPEARALIRAGAARSYLVGTAPPPVVDALARAGQLRRARILTDNAAFPLDRCEAMAFVAEQAFEQNDAGLALECLELAELAACRVTGSYRAKAAAACVEAALAIGETGRAEQLARARLAIAIDALEQERTGQREVIKMRETAHLAFWTARMLRRVFSAGESARLIALFKTALKRPWNLDLQTAAIFGETSLLIQELRKMRNGESSAAVKGNLALSLAEAGLKAEAMEVVEMTQAGDFSDNDKRLAWACAVCEDFDKALAIAPAIKHPEERMRALLRIQIEAGRAGKGDVLTAAAKLAAELDARHAKALPKDSAVPRGARLGSKKGSESGLDEMDSSARWRIESWGAQIQAIAGNHSEAIRLANNVCAQTVASTEANSLSYPTPFSARRRNHTVPQNPVDVDGVRADLENARKATDLAPIADNCHRIGLEIGLKSWGEFAVALKRMSQPEEDIVNSWLDAIGAASNLGRKEVDLIVRLAKFPGLKRAAPSPAEIDRALAEADRIAAAAHVTV